MNEDTPYQLPPPIWDTAPTFTNAEGIKWWVDKDLTRYAREPDQHDTRLPSVSVWYVQKPNGYRCRVILEGDQIEYETQKLEDAAVHIEMMKATVRFAPKQEGTP